tara:strand:- start:233 stop:406 length:174 start_codon:yes stop_codon:yes gene_type:complete
MLVKNEVEVVNAIRRMELKVDNLRLEFKATGNPRKYDMDEVLSLIEKLKSNLQGGRA